MRALLLLLLIPAVAAAQIPPVKLAVDPAAEARPALRYSLLPEARDRVTGNAVLHYLKAQSVKPAIEWDAAKRKAEAEMLIKWDDAKIGELPKEEMGEYLKKYKAMFRELEYGARCKECDWAGAPTHGTDAIDLTVGGVQAYREQARLLTLKFKLELAEKRTDDALRTIQTGLQFGRHIAEGPSLIQMLVGNAITSIFLARIEQFIEQPNAPNLYWALSALPKPLIDPRPGLDGEDALNESFLPGLTELRQGAVPAERAKELVSNAMKTFTGLTNKVGGLGQNLFMIAQAEVGQEDARKELIARGRNAAQVGAMPAVQAVFVNSFERYREIADEYRKWFLLSGPDAIAGIEKLADRLKKAKADPKNDSITQVFLNVLPAMEKVFYSLARIDRRVAQLRTLEAIRIHAAITAQLPKELADIKKVPVPVDTMSGKPFQYAIVEGGFTLAAERPKSGDQAGLTFEVTVREKK